ncbi:MAG: hypothetical protein WC264_01435 [Candidatus Paceibacterota bacterium]|jgi:hypothetical protein
MSDEIGENLIKKDKYQVFLFASPASFPISFAKHSWFVLNKKGVISRWEVMHFKNKFNKDFKYLHLNNRAPFLGIGLIWPISKFFWKAKLLGYIEGEENSTVKKMIEFIENSEKNILIVLGILFWVQIVIHIPNGF